MPPLDHQSPANQARVVKNLVQRLKTQLLGINRLFLITVFVPTLLAIIYYGLVTSDIYISESRFVVRSPQKQSASGLGSLLQGAGFSKAQDDAYSVHDYMLSRDALKRLDEKLLLKNSFGNQNVDVFSRFGGLGWDESFEALFRYYQKRILIDTDAASSISSLRVSAFTGEDAYRINEMLLQLGEGLVNQLNERGRQDMIRFAAADVSVAEKQAKAAALSLSSYRSANSVFDPEKQSAIQLSQISKLQDDLIATKTQLAHVRTFTPDNPQIPALQKRVESFQGQIDIETAKVAGGPSSLTNKAAEFQRLALERDFADKQLAIALASLEQARNDAQRKQLYLERIVQPNTPDVGIEPRRIKSVFGILIFGLIAWGVLSILLAGVREHRA
jgi:capsular polysaccharide transport system permease protein